MKRIAQLATLAFVWSCAEGLPTAMDRATVRPRSAASSGTTLIDSATFLRTTGAPNVYEHAVSTAGFADSLTLHVRNGTPAGANRVTSGELWFEGARLLGPSDFRPDAAEWTFTVAADSIANLRVRLASKPGSFLVISLSGTPELNGTLFCPDARPGSIADLSDAVDATPDDGTVFVCDGDWMIDEELVSKPITIRSATPGGATLRDSDPAPSSQGGRPAIIVTGIAGGTVRLVDLRFIVRGRAVLAQHPYDQLVIDSSVVTGLLTTAGFMVYADSSAVPGARLEVMNSQFYGGMVGVFPVRGIRADVHHNLFDGQQVSGVIHSGASPARYAHGTVTDNLFRNCGPTVCVRSFAGNLVFARNRIEVNANFSRGAAIEFRRFTPLPAVVLPIVIEDNVIVGATIGGVSPALASWGAQRAIWAQDAASGLSNIVRRNQVDSVHTFLEVSPTSLVGAHDNVFTTGVLAVRSSGVATVNRNDFVGLLGSIATPLAAGANLTCNWWGSVAGPVAPPGSVAAAVYTPFALTPVANQPGVVCP